MVTVTSATSGASINYTTDGSTPSATNGTVYTGPVSIGATTTLKAIAYEAGLASSAVKSGTYTITPPPVITSPLTATVQVGVAFSYQITASNSPTSDNATGLPPGLNVDTSTGLITGTPTTAGTSSITISASNSGGTGSATLVLTVNPEPVSFIVSPVSFTYNGSNQGPTITPSVSGATYSISGTASATTAGSYTVTATATGNYTGASGPIAWTIAQATPVVSWTTPAPIVYGTALDSTELNATANVPGTFAYTPAAGTVPNVGTQTLSVVFTPTDATDYNNASASVSLTVNPPLTAAPVFSPAAGSYPNAQTVAITTTTSGASIRYTTDGSTPTETTGNPYSGPLTLSSTTTLTAIAYETGFTDSAVTSGIYTLQAAAPNFSPAAGTYTSAQTVTINSATNGASIRYTTDGSIPTETTGTLYSGSVSIGTTTTLQAIVYEPGFIDSTVTSGFYAINLPPTITPNASSLTFGSSDNVSLSFSATDFGGSVGKVELYRDGVLDTTLTSPTSSFTWTFTEASTLPPGSYTFTGIAYNNSGGSTTSAPVTVTVLPSLPYLTDFESSEGYILGSLNQQLGWSVLQGSATVTNQDHFSGAQSAVLPPSVPPAQIVQTFSLMTGENVIFVDFFAKPVAEADITTATTFNVGCARFAFVLNGGQGILEAFNGNGQGHGVWTPTNLSVPLGTDNQSQNWIQLTARLDFTQGTWDLYANGTMVAANQGFLDSTSTTLTSFSVQGDAATASEVDDILAGTNNPLFADVNNDGIDDAWETAHGLSRSVNDRNLTAANGSTVLHDYINGIDPTDYYGGVLPVLTSQVDPSGVPGAQGLVSVKVTRASDGTPLANAPVTLAVTTGVSTISATPGGAGSTQVSVLTDSTGTAAAYVNLGSSASDMLVATAHSGSQATSIFININLPFTNTSIPGLCLWLKADDPGIVSNNGNISLWPDNSLINPANNATQSNGSNQPTLVANGLNGRPVVHFAGGQSLNLPNVMNGASAGEIFVVVRSTALNNALWWWGGSNGNLYPYSDGNLYEDFGTTTWTSLGKPAADLTQYNLYNVSSSSSEWTQRINGLVNYDRLGNTVSFRATPVLGMASSGVHFTGDIAEVIVYDHVLTPQEKETVGFYLNSKYAFTSPAAFDSFRDGNYDGLPDALDRQLGFDPTSMDVDNDGDTNLQDILAGLDPLDPLSVLPPPLPPIPGNPPPTIILTEPANAVPLN